MGGDTNGRRFIYVPTNFIRNAGDPVQRQQTQAGEATRWSEEDDEDRETVGGRDTLEITARVTREANSAYWCERNLSGQPGSSGGSADNDGGRRGVPVGVYRRLAERVPGDEARLVVHERTGRSVFVTRGLGPSEAGDDVMDSSDGGDIADSSNSGGIADSSNGGDIADSSNGGGIANSNAGVHVDRGSGDIGRGSGDEDTENFSCNLEYSSDVTDGMTSLSEQTSFAVAESRSVDALPTTPRTSNETTSGDYQPLVINPTSISQTTNPPPARLSTAPVPTNLPSNSVTSTTRPLSLINRIPLSSTPRYQSTFARGLLQSPPIANPTPSSHPIPNPTPSSHPIPNPTPSSHPIPNPTPSSHSIPLSDNISQSDFVHSSQPPMPPLRNLQLNNSPNTTNSTQHTPTSHPTRTPSSHSTRTHTSHPTRTPSSHPTNIPQRTPLRIVPSLLSDHRIATSSPQLPTRPSSSHTSISSRSPASRCHRRSGSESRRVGPVPLLTLRRSSALPPRDATVPAADSTRNRSIVISEFPGI